MVQALEEPHEKNWFAAFYAAPNGAWRLGELTFYKHDAPNGAHLNHYGIPQ